MNVKLNFAKTKWRIQYGGHVFEKVMFSKKIYYLEVFRAADYESEIKFFNTKNGRSNMADMFLRKW